MHRSSETIGAIAAALAKAQAELANPEKLMVGTIRSANPYENNRTFKYAALASGLDIVRKSLGGQEIATVQTTAIDREAGVIRLTTVLAHSSGEWLSSEWPVCAMSEMASPRRMGAALTYARRYALFTLVGIAGEDDLDAPDLNDRSNDDLGPPPSSANDEPQNPGLGASPAASARPTARRAAAPSVRAPRSILAPEESEIQRDRLLREVRLLATPEDAAAWAHLSLPAKNTLTIEDAQKVEQAFREKLSAFPERNDSKSDDEPPNEAGPSSQQAATSFAQLAREIAAAADQSAGLIRRRPPVAKTIRFRDREHRRFVSTQPCLICGRRPADPHHLRFAQPRALGRKVSDEFTVPVCRLHHRELHNWGDEAAWWHSINIDPIPIALKLWAQSRPNGALGSSPRGLVIGVEGDPLLKLFEPNRRAPPLP
jgi:hypothetical protein